MRGEFANWDLAVDLSWDTLDSFQTGLEALLHIQKDLADGKKLNPMDRKLWTACEQFVKTWRQVSTKVVEGLKS